VFEDAELNEKITGAVEKQIHYGDNTDPEKTDLPAQQVEARTIV
jgi:hypothetical protein